MTMQFSPIIFTYFLVSLILLFLSYRTWKMRATRGAIFWALTMLFSAIFSLGTGFETLFTEPALKLAMIPIVYLGVTGLIYFWGLFCISYSNYQRWLNKYSVTLLAIIPLITFILALFSEHHQLIYQEYEFVNHNGFVLSKIVSYGSFFWVWVAYSYISLVGGTILLIQSIMRFPHLYKEQTRLLILSVLVPSFANFLYLLGLNPIDPFDLTPLALTISGILMLLAMGRYGFLNIVPIAHDVIFDNVESAVFIIDLQGHILNLNRSAENTFGRARDEVIGKHVNDAFPEYLDYQKTFREVMKTKTEITLGEHTYELRITPLTNRRGQIAGRVVMFYNITERKQMEQKEIELAVEKERVQVLQDFVRHASHDLKTPLATMKTYHFLLKREFGDNARLDILEEESTRLTKLIDNMLMMVRLEGDHVPHIQKIDINPIIRYVISDHKCPNCPSIEFLPESESIMIQANEQELELALSHLISNAKQNTNAEGTIRLRTSYSNNSVEIHIEDTGVGIPEEDLPRIFERFYRVDKARNTQSGGTGLGLAIVKRVVERHHGTIEVSSTVGEGTEFCMTLPVGEDAES